MPLLTVAGARAHYAHRRPVPASGPPVVFVHGAGGTHQHWLYQVRDLPHSPTYALDLPGHGRSEGQGRDVISAYGDWLVAFLDAAGLDQAVLVGHSMGGAIVLDTALRHPGRVAGLGLVATGARLRVAPAILDGILQNPEATVRLICDFAFGPETPPEMVRMGRRQMEAVPPEVIHGDFAACDAFSVMDRLGEIAAPVFVLCGSQDRLTPSKYSVYLRDRIARAVLHLVEGAGHMVMVERPEAVVHALSSFLGSL
ncbi:MAG: alpha/beta fold hydrolase [Anaerolineae bacterium]|nr:alpha/beta fold hydrolase [Anaerolineae bacterium]